MEFPPVMPSKDGVIPFDVLHRSGLVKTVNDDVKAKKIFGNKSKVMLMPSSAARNDNDENLVDVTLADAAVSKMYSLKQKQIESRFNAPKQVMTPAAHRSQVMKSLVNNKTVHTIIHGSHSSKTTKPITYARDLAGLKASPTILLQNLTGDGAVIEDATIEMEQTHNLAGYFQDCSIDIERNEAITCTTAFLSAETLQPFPDTRKPKPRTLENLFEEIADDSSDGMIEHEEGAEIMEEWRRCQQNAYEKYTNIPKKLETLEQRYTERRTLEQKYASTKRRKENAQDSHSEPQAKKQKKGAGRSSVDLAGDIAMSAKSTTATKENASTDVFEGVTAGNIVARQVNLNELLELNEMMDDGENSEEENESGNLDNSAENQSEEMIEPQDIKVEPELNLTEIRTIENANSTNDNDIAGNIVAVGVDYVIKEEESEDDNNACESDDEATNSSEKDSNDYTDKTGQNSTASELKEEKNEKPTEKDSKVERVKESENKKENDSDEEVVGSSWLDDYIDEFEEENEKEQQPKLDPKETNKAKPDLKETHKAKPDPKETNKAKPDPKETNKAKPDPKETNKANLDPKETNKAKPDLKEAKQDSDEANEKSEDVPREEEILQDDSFTQVNLEHYLLYMNQIDENGKPTNERYGLICEKCRQRYASAYLLFKHLNEKSLCEAMYKLLESATFAKDPLLERKEERSYMEVFGCYACSYSSYDPSEVRQHWLREHLEDGQYLCKYCNAEFHTSFRCALHVLTYHSNKPLHVALAPSPMYRQHLVFDMEPVRRELFQQLGPQVTPAMKPIVLESSRTPPEKNVTALENPENKMLFCLCCKHCSTEQIFETASELRAHINTYHRSSLRCFRCSLCSITLPGQFDLRRHVATVHQRFIGNAKVFSDFDGSKLEKLAAKSHYVHYKGAYGYAWLPYVCGKCYDHKKKTGKGSVECFATKTELAIHHGKEHLGLKKINCLLCNKPYNDSGWCSECQSGVDVVYRCYLDALGSVASSALHSLSAQKAAAGPRQRRSLLLEPPMPTAHSPSAGRLRLMVCSVCCFKAEDRTALMSHIKNAHTFCRPYKCSQCNYAALDMSRMHKHEVNAHNNTSLEHLETPHDMKKGFYKAILDTVAQSLILDIDATDRNVILFEGDNMLKKVVDREVPNQNLNLIRLDIEADTTAAKTKKAPEKGLMKNVPLPTHTGRMQPCIIDKGLYLNIEERIMPDSLVNNVKQEIEPTAGGSQEDQTEEQIAASLGLPSDVFLSSNSTVTGDRLNNPPYFKCHMCHFDTNKHSKLVEHLAIYHQTNKMGNQGQYWQCYLCGYCAKDRSCIGRHVKYIHMSRRPHACPYCDYNSIEKTKVRIHVMGNHKNQPVVVRTDDSLLHVMSQAVKKYIYYVHGDVRVLECDRQAALLPIPSRPEAAPQKPIVVSTRVKINTSNYVPPNMSKKKSKKRKCPSDLEEDTVQWAVYEMEQDQWTDLGLQKKKRRHTLPPRYRNDPKLKSEPKVVVKDVMLWMIGKLEKEYGV